MKYMFKVIKEQLVNIDLIYRLALYDIKSKYGMHYLGAFWQFLNPMIQVAIYWFVFGIGIREGSPVDGIPYFVWLICGLIPWFFIGPTITQTSNSVYTKVNLVSKMKFPVSLLPTISLMGNLFHFIILVIILILILFLSGVGVSYYLLQFPYYLFATIVFIFASALLFSTISTVIRDFQLVLQSSIRMLLYLTPILWDVSKLDGFLINILKLNPLFYLIDGYRSTFLGKEWFYENFAYTCYFWMFTLLVLFIGSLVHVKFRNNFVDYI